MKPRLEKLGEGASVKGTMLEAHLSWADARVPEARHRILPGIERACADLLRAGVLATSWVPFRCLIAVDRAIAALVGGTPEQVFRELGRHSASLNLSGVYKGFVADEPHRFFEKSARLHDRFQDFGAASYEQVGERQGRMRLVGYPEYSPVFCASGQGFYEEALRLLKAPGPIRVAETSCQCAGDPACTFDLRW